MKPFPLFRAALAAALSMIPFALAAAPPAVPWALRGGGVGNDKIRDIAPAPDGGVFITGEFSDTADLGPFSLESAGALDFVVAKLDAQGSVLWATRAGGAGIERGYAVAPATDGGCYVTGHFQSASLDLGVATLINNGDYDWFVARFDATGQCVWARGAGGVGYDYGHGLVSNAEGEIVVGGTFTGAGVLGSESVGEAAGRSAVIAKFSPDGELVWARSSSGTGSNAANDVGRNPRTGDFYLCGNVQGQTSFGDIKLPRCQVQEPFVAAYDKNGKVKWVRLLGGSSAGVATRVVADEKGQIYLTGMGKGTLEAGKSEAASRGDHDFFAASFTSSGNPLWVHTGGGTGIDYGLGLAAFPGGGCVVTGTMAQESDFLGQTLPGFGLRDVFAVSLKPSGQLIEAASLGGLDNEMSYAVAVDGDGVLTLAGAFHGQTDFGGTLLKAKGKGGDLFVVRLGPKPAPDPEGD